MTGIDVGLSSAWAATLEVVDVLVCDLKGILLELLPLPELALLLAILSPCEMKTYLSAPVRSSSLTFEYLVTTSPFLFTTTSLVNSTSSTITFVGLRPRLRELDPLQWARTNKRKQMEIFLICQSNSIIELLIPRHLNYIS